mmetsp:Transcript_16598/g.23319  ORF Transcript_16598/g.23319 Transcript_16598/m.23319 type:complete len:417 (-) Transcript_16598:296-1546(-)|eukprot:CAMPEP_0175104366 /NCGR_PEP_ID=MMETSP0086_2-20121207/9689_1 /TAXON_ID=136419 /ORGANISM="Unknown Unknown, Strain D1" /LENGTH=416 /DNA_ID=CAMNT_0016379753 /DNA_START=74 /DNA_END=1324 /DNA_ORIENTATION=-
MADLEATQPLPTAEQLSEDRPVRPPILEHDSTLSIHDSYRFRAMVEETAERLELLGMIMTDSSRRRELPENQSRNRKDVFHLMVSQKDLEDKFETLMHRRSQLRGLSNKTKYLQNQAELKEITESLRESTNNIYQNLKDQPTIVSNMQKVQKDRHELQDLLVQTTEDLKQCSFKTLIEQVTHRMEQQRLLNQTELAHEKTRESLKNLEMELRAEREGFGVAMESKDKEIRELTAELKKLKKVTSLSLKYEKETAEAAKETIERMRNKELSSYRKNIENTREAVARDTLVHDNTAGFLQQQKDNLDKLAADWEGKYEKDHGELTADFDKLTEQRGADKEVLVRFQERWEVDKAEKKAKMEENKQREQDELNKQKLVKIMNLSHAKISFMWRVFKRKGGGKGKKGGKKKGSKKGKSTR